MLTGLFYLNVSRTIYLINSEYINPHILKINIHTKVIFKKHVGFVNIKLRKVSRASEFDLMHSVSFKYYTCSQSDQSVLTKADCVSHKFCLFVF